MPKARAAIIPVTPFQQNCTLLWDEDSGRGAVIDPGGDLDRVEQAIGDMLVTVEKILLTHGHVDHVAGAEELRARLGVPIAGPHRGDQFLLERLEETGPDYGIEARNVVPDRWLEDGDTVEIGGMRFDILHCPGHSPGSVVYANRAANFAIVGDVLFRGSIGRTDLPGGNHQQLLDSIAGKLLTLGDGFGFICGHGPSSNIGDERRHNPFLQGLRPQPA
jgi:glyoxylase-like metal-dependent hydrolase (beta-lactamase superfamily II)